MQIFKYRIHFHRARLIRHVCMYSQAKVEKHACNMAGAQQKPSPSIKWLQNLQQVFVYDNECKCSNRHQAGPGPGQGKR